MKIFIQISEAKRILSFALLPRQGKGSKGMRGECRELCIRHEVRLLLLRLQIHPDKRREKLHCVQIYIATVQFVFVLEMALGHGRFISEVHTRWSVFNGQSHVPMSVQIPREPRFSSVLWNVQRLLPALHSQADQLLVLTCIILDFLEIFSP